jgi:g-D-glutamyl-meso-diaminopimelate peptidase
MGIINQSENLKFLLGIREGGKNMKRYMLSIIFLMLIILSVSVSFSTVDNIIEIDMKKDYSTKQLNSILEQIKLIYPNRVEIETLGNSYGKLEIKVIRIKKVTTTYDFTKRYNKGVSNYLITGGIHGRETVNAKLLIKQIIYYLENNLIPDNVVLHYIPLINPDGYELSLFGPDNIENASYYLGQIDDLNYLRWKSNLRGTDINRNFPDIYLNLDTMKWIDIRGQTSSDLYVSENPSGAYYFGKEAGSEVETLCVMNYIKRYRLDGSVDYHSQGNVIYWRKWFMSKQYNNKVNKLVKQISNMIIMVLVISVIILQMFIDVPLLQLKQLRVKCYHLLLTMVKLLLIMIIRKLL